MTQGFFQFNNTIINGIANFATSSFDLLFLSGQKGSGKSETIEKVMPFLEEKNLVFTHFCFENTVIDDFLLNFYDELRNFSITQKISLKKFATDDFKEKVSHYFKAIGLNCIVIVENYEKVNENVEIVDFLSHLASYENVKIIIVTRNSEKNLFRFKPIKIKTLTLEEINKEDFKSQISALPEMIDKESAEKFYEITQGLELYLKMSIKYCTITDLKLKDLINEYERKNIILNTDFEEFIVSKFISLTPIIYQSLFKILCTISHLVSKEFLEEYKLGNVNYISYLIKSGLINQYKNEIYVKDYFKEYVTKTFSIQEKMSYYKKLIDIYENELTKSPKDRLLRLSRESIRKELELFKILMPSLNSQNKNQNALSYIELNSSNWQENLSAKSSKLMNKFNRIKERKQALTKEENDLLSAKRLDESGQKSLVKENKDKNRKFIVNLINSSREYTKNYKYDDAITELNRAIAVDYDGEFKIELYSLCAKNYEKLNEYNLAQKFYREAMDFAIETKDSRKCELEFAIALIDKNLYKTELAKKQFATIAKNELNPVNYRAKAYLELGEIEEAASDIDMAIKVYKNALALVLGKNKELCAKCYYRLAVLYDENQDTENAIKCYTKNYTTSSERKENKYYSISLTNLALIYIEQSKYKEASEFLKLALMFDSENNDLENIYFSQKELAKLYTRIDVKTALSYYKQALNTSRKLSDTFKEALVYFEVGELYYDKQDDKLALINFFNAKEVLKNSPNSENMARINSRIKDLKIRLDKKDFEEIAVKYD